MTESSIFPVDSLNSGNYEYIAPHRLQQGVMYMTDIAMHPDDLDDVNDEQLAGITDFYVKIGLMKAGDRFVRDANSTLVDEKAEPEAVTGVCQDACRAAYEIAKVACNGTLNYGKCRKRAKKAYQACLLVCDI